MRFSRRLDRSEVITRRSFLLLLIKFFSFLLLVARVIYLQLFKSKTYKTLSDQNRINIEIILPKRGEIVDINDLTLASNKNGFSLIFNKGESKNFREVLIEMARLLDIPNDISEELINHVKNAPRKAKVKILSNLTWADLVKISENSYLLPGLQIKQTPIRFYHDDFSCSHILGYMGQITEKEKENLSLTYAIDLSVGKSGVEKFYENSLRGTFGWMEVESNAFGVNIRELSYNQSKPGERLVLTIDSNLQKFIYDLCQNLVATIVVSDVTNGNILSLVSTPSFDQNKVANKANAKYWKEINRDSNKPMLNRALQSSYPPGSVFKIITILSALRSGIPTDKVFTCTGQMPIGSHIFRCWYRKGHGNLDMRHAVIHSCNCYMYNIVKLIGHDVIINTARDLGLGYKTNIDMPFELAGFVGDDIWKQKRFKSSWTLGDSYNLSIGQGFLGVTALQLINLINYIANKGKIFEPRITLNKINQEFTSDIPEKYFDFIFEALYSVVNKPGGTAYGSRNVKLDEVFSGKTGTSQVLAKKKDSDDFSKTTTPWHYRNHGIFIGFNSGTKPKHSVAVIVEHGGTGSGSAAPLAQKIFQKLSELKNNIS